MTRDMSKQSDGELDHNDNCIEHFDENFVGYGEDESTPTSASVTTRRLNRREPQLSNNSSYQNGDLNVLHKAVDKFLSNTGLRPGLELPDKETIVQALQTVLQNVNRDDDLWEWLEETDHFTAGDVIFAPNSLETSSNRGSLESSSSLGLLSYSDLSSFSLTSQDVVKESDSQQKMNGKAQCDPVELLCEIEELHHQNRKLAEENVRLQKQVTQTEDSNSQLFLEKEQLEKVKQSLQLQTEKKRELEQESTVLRLTLTSLEELNSRLQMKIAAHEKEKVELETRIQDLHDELCGNQTLIDTWHQRIDELSSTLVESKISYENLKSIHDVSCSNLKEKMSELEQKELVMKELIASNEVLKLQKNELELQLCKAEQEIACLQHAARQVRSLSADVADGDGELNTSCEASLLMEDCSGSPEEKCRSRLSHSPRKSSTTSSSDSSHKCGEQAVLFSTPRKPLLVRRLSLCAEMRNVVRSGGGDLPSPFCGKHIFPQALYNEEVIPPRLRLTSSLPSLDENGHDHSKPRLDLCLDCPHKCQDKSSGSEGCESCQEVSSKDLEVKGHEEKLRESVLAAVCRDLQEININIQKINEEAMSVLIPFPEIPGCVISEPEAVNNNMISDDKDPMTLELRLLRSHIANTQAILTYLSKSQKGLAHQTLSKDLENNRNASKSSLEDAANLLHHLSSDMVPNSHSTKTNSKPFWISKDSKGGSTSPSRHSTPLYHRRWLTRSCPNIPYAHSAQPSTSKATQTEPTLRDQAKMLTLAVVEQSEITGTSPEVQPRHRSSSFVAAISQGDGATEKPPSSNSEGVTVQAQPNREVFIVKDSTQDTAYSVQKQDEYRDIDFHDTLQEFRKLQQSEEEDEDCWEERLRRTQSEDVPEVHEAAKKRRRSFSEYKSSYCKTIDLEEHKEAEEVDDDEEDTIFEDPQTMVCEPESIHPPTSEQSFHQSTDLMETQVVGVTTTTPSNPVLRLVAAKLEGSNLAATHLGTQKHEKGLGRRRCGDASGGNKGRFLMPEAMENSETESAKDSANGSMESEGLPAAAAGPAAAHADGDASPAAAENFVAPPPPGNDPAFPSLPDTFLKKIGLDYGSKLSPEDLSSQEVECKFGTLSLAFKTDKFTLGKRLELQQRQRDTAEKNIDNEVVAMREVLNNLNQLSTDTQMRELITKLQHHLDIIQQSTSRMSSRAEVFGAVQQQDFLARVSSAVESLGSGKSAGHLERLLIGGSLSGSTTTTSAPPSATPGPSGGVLQNLSFPSSRSQIIPTCGAPPQLTESQLQLRSTISNGITQELNSEDCKDQETKTESASSSEIETTKEKKHLLAKVGHFIKAGCYGDSERSHPGDEKKGLDSVCSLQTGNGQTNPPLSASSLVLPSCDSGPAPISFLRQILGNKLIRKGCSMFLACLPDDAWWTHWDMNRTTRALRYALGSLLLLAALFSLIATFLPVQDVPFNMFANPSCFPTHYRSVQELLEIIFGPYVSRRQDSTYF